ncbi:hypothetical protein BLOT_005283 [Blomia tropicalis]|nr:hypothetical protein BLOT_005283 [Blomia tropicalis]
MSILNLSNTLKELKEYESGAKIRKYSTIYKFLVKIELKLFYIEINQQQKQLINAKLFTKFDYKTKRPVSSS